MNKISLVTIPMHILAAVWLIIGLSTLFLPLVIDTSGVSTGFLIGLGLAIIILAIAIEVVLNHFKNGRHWAWIVIIILAGVHVPSYFVVLAIPAFVGLFSKEVREFIKSQGQIF